MSQEPRFSRRFLTLLIVITALAVALLLRLQPPADTEETVPSQSESETRANDQAQ